MESALSPALLNSVIAEWWKRLTLATRFAIIGGMVMIICAVAVGRFVTARIQQAAIDNSAAATALYIDSLISPLLENVGADNPISIGPIMAIEELLNQDIGREFVSVKVWRRDGTLIYATDHDIIGNRFPPSEELLRAFNGQVVAEQDSLGDAEDLAERTIGKPLLEIYSPVRQHLSGNIVAVAEFYEVIEALDRTLAKTRTETWGMVAMLTLFIAGALTGIVRSGSRTIEEQKNAIQRQLASESESSRQNRILRERIERASARTVELNEQYLRQISAELHDGPAQLLGLAALRIDSLRKKARAANRQDMEIVHNALQDAMQEIRNISRGLRLPDIEKLGVTDIIAQVCAAHSARTESAVEQDLFAGDIPATYSVKITTYRFVQETLNNAFLHAGGRDQRVVCHYDVDRLLLTISVSDGGPGINRQSSAKGVRGLGLPGLQERIESIGGTFEIMTGKNAGTTVRMTVPIGREV
ncbi:MAG: sensor histidine kinase [Nitratireductor sp.]|nr:sensor histidine kinase [Nitratireductor sp.]